jgi:hypothetical protein
MKSKKEIPNIFTYSDINQFFTAFVKFTLPQWGLSQRAFSRSIGWPASYVPDVISGRKKFTLERAVEFGNHIDVTSEEFEMLLFLAIHSVVNRPSDLVKLKKPFSELDIEFKQEA